jgi:SpoVK/Ycf46/Vps4 family AAA+-type ATPase
MARSDLILRLVRSASAGDRRALEKSVAALAAEERAKRHGVFADKLEKELQQSSVTTVPFKQPQEASTLGGFWTESIPERSLDSIILPDLVRFALSELVEEQMRADLLRSHGIEPRHKVLLTGPPGNGKTSAAAALATELMVPLITPRYESIIGSYLGETAGRLGKLFEYVRGRPCVLFLDEFDTLGRERADPNETGEIKRVVTSLLMQIDDLPSYVVAVTATNHPETLDRAVWRRFQLRLNLPSPTQADAIRWFDSWSEMTSQPLGMTSKTLATNLKADSYSDLEDYCSDVQRRMILAGPDADPKIIFKERLSFWKERVLQSELPK